MQVPNNKDKPNAKDKKSPNNRNGKKSRSNGGPSNGAALLVEPHRTEEAGHLGKLRELRRKRQAEEENIEETRREMRATLTACTPKERDIWLRELYDEFSKKYDCYMEKTGHYDAMRQLISGIIASLMRKSRELVRLPILDLTAGTGAPLEFLLREINKRYKKKSKFRVLDVKGNKKPLVWVNDLSGGMIAKARERFSRLGLKKIRMSDIGFSKLSFREFKESYPGLEGAFGTVLIAQTFHITPDKEMLAEVAGWALAPGGLVMVFEEFPWRVSSHSDKLLEDIEDNATPIPHKSELYPWFKSYSDIEVVGQVKKGKSFSKIVRSTMSIDSPWHEMSAIVLQKPPVPED